MTHERAMQLIADSGSTKTAWCALLPDGTTLEIPTAGINPVRDDETTVCAVVAQACGLLESELRRGRASSAAADCHVREVHFYGAGCIAPYAEVVRRALVASFSQAGIAVESDLLGAARALCGHDEGIACILGTGSNSCLYDGRALVQNTPALGWILGDEGSGAVLGRRLVGDVLKGQLSAPLREAFGRRFGLTQADIIERVYRSAQPNRFLASLVPFLAEHVAESEVRAFLAEEFRRFLRRNVVPYERPDLPVHFVGGVAAQFRTLVAEAVEAEGLRMGQVEPHPVAGMVRYHR